MDLQAILQDIVGEGVANREAFQNSLEIGMEVLTPQGWELITNIKGDTLILSFEGRTHIALKDWLWQCQSRWPKINLNEAEIEYLMGLFGSLITCPASLSRHIFDWFKDCPPEVRRDLHIQIGRLEEETKKDFIDQVCFYQDYDKAVNWLKTL